MRRLSLFILLSCFSTKSISQDTYPAFQKKSHVIQLGYGVGNIWKWFLKEGISPEFDYKVKSTGPFALTYEYGLFRHLSIGIIGGYSVLKGRFDFYGQKVTDKLTSFSLLARANYHYLKWKKIDAYVGGGLGYYHFRYEALDPAGEPAPFHRVPGEFGYSLQLGARYFFSDVLGFYLEAGYVGGSVGQLGVSLRL